MLEIIESYINGQFRQLFQQVKEYGFYDFAYDIEKEETLTTKQKLEITCFIIRKLSEEY